MNAPLIILSGSSGSGKTTFCYRIEKQIEALHRIITYTTRAPRPGEQNGVDYWFVSSEKFDHLERAGKFIETVTFGGNRYAVHTELLDRLKQGQPCIVIPDINGAKKILPLVPDAITIWLHVPLETLEIRIRERGTEVEESIQARLSEARREEREVQEADIYQHIIPVRDYEVAFQNLAQIISTAL